MKIKTIILCALFATVGSGCSLVSKSTATTPETVVCTSQQECQDNLSSACKNGGVIHDVTPGLVIHFTCND